MRGILLENEVGRWNAVLGVWLNVVKADGLEGLWILACRASAIECFYCCDRFSSLQVGVARLATLFLLLSQKK
jgi:hypothetical protein